MCHRATCAGGDDGLTGSTEAADSNDSMTGALFDVRFFSEEFRSSIVQSEGSESRAKLSSLTLVGRPGLTTETALALPTTICLFNDAVRLSNGNTSQSPCDRIAAAELKTDVPGLLVDGKTVRDAALLLASNIH